MIEDWDTNYCRQKYHDGEYQFLPKDRIERYHNRYVWGSDGGPIMTKERLQCHSGRPYDQKNVDAYITQHLLQELVAEIVALKTALKTKDLDR